MRSARLTTVLMALFVAACAAFAAAEPALAADDPNAMARRVLELTNQERGRAGLPPFRWNDTLTATAADFAGDLAARNYFSHTSPEGTHPWDRAKQHGYPTYGWGDSYVGENLAKGYNTPDEVMKGWMNSEGHRANILKPEYREIGVALVTDSAGRKVWVQNFGSQPKVLPLFINGDAPTTDSPLVTLSITCEEVSNWGSLDKASEMMLSNSADFAGAAWEPYSRTKAWTLAGPGGQQRVFVRIKDVKGNTAESSDDIQLLGNHPVQPQPKPQSQSEAIQQVLGDPQPQSVAKPEFKLGFKALADQAPEVVGEALEEERWGDNGDSLQRTSTGLLVWRKADNWTAFTNGSRTWINGPSGVQDRANGERFSWESAPAA